jgi:DNA-binding response OmpR family regulator
MYRLEPSLCLAAGAREPFLGRGREREVAAGTGVLHAMLSLPSGRDPVKHAVNARRLQGVYARPQARVACSREVRLLLIEDDPRLAEHTAEYLRDHEATVEVVGDGPGGLERAASGEHDLVLLDVMLPGLDGLEVCRRLRQRSSIPVIMLTARGDEIDRVVGLELGADDYLPKPFSPRELLARIRAVLRRQPAASPAVADGPRLELGPLRMDRERRTAQVEAHALELTAYQFDLLWVLAINAGKVLGREQLHGQVRQLRGEPLVEFDPAVDRSIDVHMSKVRGALGSVSDAAKALIRTVRGVGYVLSDEDDTA